MTSPSALAAALRAHARGLYCDEAAAELLIAQSWLRRPGFASQFITVHPGIPTGGPWPSSTGPPRSLPWAPACPPPEESSGC